MVPSGIGELGSLVELVLDDNKLARGLPLELLSLPNLTVLSCRRNKMQALFDASDRVLDQDHWLGSSGVGAWPQLKRLDLSENALRALPARFFARTGGLAELALQKNALTEVADLGACGNRNH